MDEEWMHVDGEVEDLMKKIDIEELMKNNGIRYEDRSSFVQKLTSYEDLMQIDEEFENLMMNIDIEELTKNIGIRYEDDRSNDRSSIEDKLISHDTTDEDEMHVDEEIEQLMRQIDTEELMGLVMLQ